MYVRWKRHMLGTAERPSSEASLTAVLVRCKRVDGKPRQQLVGYLATIQEASIAHPVMRAQFWEQVRERLAGQGLSEGQRAQIVAKIAERVPRPTGEDQQSAADYHEQRGLRPGEKVIHMRTPAGRREVRRASGRNRVVPMSEE